MHIDEARADDFIRCIDTCSGLCVGECVDGDNAIARNGNVAEARLACASIEYPAALNEYIKHEK
jgi:hypothetical protein